MSRSYSRWVIQDNNFKMTVDAIDFQLQYAAMLTFNRYVVIGFFNRKNQRRTRFPYCWSSVRQRLLFFFCITDSEYTVTGEAHGQQKKVRLQRQGSMKVQSNFLIGQHAFCTTREILFCTARDIIFIFRKIYARLLWRNIHNDTKYLIC